MACSANALFHTHHRVESLRIWGDDLGLAIARRQHALVDMQGGRYVYVDSCPTQLSLSLSLSLWSCACIQRTELTRTRHLLKCHSPVQIVFALVRLCRSVSTCRCAWPVCSHARIETEDHFPVQDTQAHHIHEAGMLKSFKEQPCAVAVPCVEAWPPAS